MQIVHYLCDVMKRIWSIFHTVGFLTLLCAGVTTPVHAQRLLDILLHNDSLLSERYRSSNIDTMYITHPSTKWTITGRLYVSGAKLGMEGMQMGTPFKSEMKANYKSTLSVAWSGNC